MRKTYITTAIPYTNARPHVGHAMDYLLADAYARWRRGKGDEVRVAAGTDEYGTKVAKKAAEVGQSPQEMVDGLQESYQELIRRLNTPYTDFTRTTSATHRERVQAIWEKLRPYIYKSTYEGWYCAGCEAFLTESEAREINYECPDHHRPLEKLSEENYYFRVSEFSGRIREAIASGEMRIVPEFRAREILELIGEEAHDISISRPVEKLAWGIPVPGDDSQTMYVWIDALSNYITALGYPEADISEWWPAELQVVGKDILRFHALVWPAMLLALELPLPKAILSHGHITVDGVKMSKSIGNVIDPVETIARHGTEAFRYYFLRHVPTTDDGDFTIAKFDAAYNDELANDLGNLVQRLATMCQKYGVGGVADFAEAEADAEYDGLMERLEIGAAFDYAWRAVQGVNRRIDEEKPWAVARSEPGRVGEVLQRLVREMLRVGRLLGPFLPGTAQRIEEIFGEERVVAPGVALFPKG